MAVIAAVAWAQGHEQRQGQGQGQGRQPQQQHRTNRESGRIGSSGSIRSKDSNSIDDALQSQFVLHVFQHQNNQLRTLHAAAKHQDLKQDVPACESYSA